MKLLRSSVQVSLDSTSDLHDPRLFANFSHNYAKVQNSFEYNKFIISKLLIFLEEVAELPLKLCYTVPVVCFESNSLHEGLTSLIMVN